MTPEQRREIARKGAKARAARAAARGTSTGPTRLLDVVQIEAEYGLSRWTVRDLIAKGVLPAIRPPGLRRVFVERRDLEQAIAAWREKAE